ncbi:hypothetical protein [Candidatus Marithrix sp. Canyon 246]|uniref:hypothetical protein n=1 Tax=Candidatus Marithrix sp. Canyon 246 TaxID=1827136 RepID=UPI00149575AA|nr:hypothetical protein [Candidatus Marithrix sp. Canyon 246]
MAKMYVFLVGDAKINLEDSKVPTHLYTTQAKIKAYELGASAEVLRMFTLFGDPALSLK